MLAPCASLVLSLTATSAFAARPGETKNEIDMDTMVLFVRQHPTVLESLRAIDIQTKVVHFGKDCEVRFAVPNTRQLRPGSRAYLEVKEATCPVGPPRASPK